MISEPVVSMRELERENAELLPSRETLCVTRWQPAHCGWQPAHCGWQPTHCHGSSYGGYGGGYGGYGGGYGGYGGGYGCGNAM